MSRHAVATKIFHLQSDQLKLSSPRNPLILLTVITLILTLPQYGCVGLTSAQKPSSVSNTTQGTPTITLSPNTATVTAGGSQQFTVNVSGSSNATVTWTVSGPGCAGVACGTISATGTYLPPANIPSPATVTVKATSVADSSKSASASVTIVAAVAVLLSISPASASVPTVGTQL